MCSVVIKGLRFADTQESCFEPWKRSHMGCSALLCCRFVDSQESRFQASKRPNIDSALLEDELSPDIHEFCVRAPQRSDMDGVELDGVYLMILRNGIFRSRNVRIIEVLYCKREIF